MERLAALQCKLFESLFLLIHTNVFICLNIINATSPLSHFLQVKDFFEEHQRMRLIQLSSKKILETIETNIHWMYTKIQKVERWLMDRQNKN